MKYRVATVVLEGAFKGLNCQESVAVRESSPRPEGEAVAYGKRGGGGAFPYLSRRSKEYIS